MGARIIGSGAYLPDKCVTNSDLERIVNTSDEWIVRRTGISTRYLLEPEDDPAKMGIVAAKKACQDARIAPEQIDLLIVATNFPDMICPGSAPFIAYGLGMDRTPFFDLKAGCSGFVYGLVVADGLIRAGIYKHILLIGSEALSRVADWSDRKTCVLFGDGAGAVVLEEGEDDEGILGSAIYGDNDKSLFLHMPAGGTRNPASTYTIENKGHFLKMEGAGVYRSAVMMMETATRQALASAALKLDDVAWIIPHQANIRIIDSLGVHLDVSKDRILTNLDRVANTSTASIPIVLDEGRKDMTIRTGDVVVMTAFGAGVTYGAVVVRM
jgi:3-oxoacyl-[acyl-carrier-protein] synthase III